MILFSILSPTEPHRHWKIIIKTTTEPHRHCKWFFLVYWVPQTSHRHWKTIIKTTTEPHRHCKNFFLLYWSPTEPHRHCKSFLLVHMESHRHPTDIEKLLIRLPMIPTDMANDCCIESYFTYHEHIVFGWKSEIVTKKSLGFHVRYVSFLSALKFHGFFRTLEMRLSKLIQAVLHLRGF